MKSKMAERKWRKENSRKVAIKSATICKILCTGISKQAKKKKRKKKKKDERNFICSRSTNFKFDRYLQDVFKKISELTTTTTKKKL